MFECVEPPCGPSPVGCAMSCHWHRALQNVERKGNQRTDLDRPCFAFFDLGTKLSTAKCSNFPLGLVL